MDASDTELEEAVIEILDEYELDVPSGVNLSSTYFRLDTNSYFWWIQIEGVGWIYVGFALVLLIVEFTAFPYLLWNRYKKPQV